MFQSVYYDYKSYTYFLRDDVEGWSNFKYQPTYYQRCSEHTEGALPVLTGGFAKPTKKLVKEDTSLLEKDINKELVLLRDLYYKQDEVIPSWHNILFLDIEIEIMGALTPEFIKNAIAPITSIALYDKTTKQKICFIVDKSKEITEISLHDKKVIPCISERELMGKFLSKLEELDPTIMVGYNSSYFDIPYLYYRIGKVLGEASALKLSPIGKVNIQEWDEANPIRLGGVNHLDFMLLFKKYITKQEPSYKLGEIGFKYVELGKIEYDGNLNQLFKNDKEAFIEYNFRDVEILDKLEDKLKFVDLTIMLSHICNIPYDQIYYNTMMNEGAILKFLKLKGIVSPNKPTTHNPHLKEIKESYAGGFIKQPNVGLYFDVIDLDFTSLYPSIIKSLNLGIETLIGRIRSDNNSNYEQELSLERLKSRDPNEEVVIEMLDKINYTLKSSQTNIGKIIKIIEDNKYTISASGGIFRTDERSVVAKILEGWFEKREHYRGLKKQAGKAEDWANYKLYDLFQHAFKILQNAMYGTFALNTWRYTDGHKICSASITNTGQRLTKESIDFVNNKINQETGKKEDNIIISDTDSLYICIKSILDSRYKDLNKEEKNSKILEIANDIQSHANNSLNALSKRLFNVDPGKHFFQLKQEVIAQSVIVTGKRRYAMFITNKEGVEISAEHKDALDLKGLEVMKSNMNKIFRKFGENIIKNILFGKNKKDIDQSIIDFHKALKKTDPKLLGKPTGVSYLKKYIKNKPSSGNIFSTFELKAPTNTKAAVRFNDLLRFKNLDKKHECIIEGDKIFIINLKPNPYHIETIAIPNGKVPEEIEKFINMYIDIDEIFESMILNKLKELWGDINWTFPELNSNISKFLIYED